MAAWLAGSGAAILAGLACNWVEGCCSFGKGILGSSVRHCDVFGAMNIKTNVIDDLADLFEEGDSWL
jgi:hypothetical protein